MTLEPGRETGARWDGLALGVIVLGILVRVWHLTAWDFWTDELHTITISRTGQYSFGPTYITAPLNFILTAWSLRIFGINELGARVVPFLAGILTVALVYPLGKAWVGRRAAAIGALLIAIAPWHVYWSQTARHFSLQALLILLALNAFLLFWHRETWRNLLMAGLAFVLALAVHSSSVFYLLAALAFVAWAVVLRLFGRWRAEARESGPLLERRHVRAAVGLGGVLLAYVPIWVLVGTHLLNTVKPWNPLWNLLGSVAFYMPPYISLTALAGALFLAREGNDAGSFLLSMIVVPIILLALASFETIASAAYVLSSLIPACILAGAALDRLLSLGEARGVRWPAAALAAGVPLAFLGELALYHSVYHGLKPRWREAAAYVRAHERPGDVVAAAEADVMGFYLGQPRTLWFSSVQEKLASDRFPPAGAPGAWYVIYLADDPLTAGDRAARDHVIAAGRLCKILPLNYGPKDRTLGVFYESANRSSPGNCQD